MPLEKIPFFSTSDQLLHEEVEAMALKQPIQGLVEHVAFAPREAGHRHPHRVLSLQNPFVPSPSIVTPCQLIAVPNSKHGTRHQGAGRARPSGLE